MAFSNPFFGPAYFGGDLYEGVQRIGDPYVVETAAKFAAGEWEVQNLYVNGRII